MNTEHHAPCVDGNVCGEPAHCPPAEDDSAYQPRWRDWIAWASCQEDGVRDDLTASRQYQDMISASVWREFTRPSLADPDLT